MSEVHTITTSNYDDALIKVFTQGFTRNVDENDEVTHEEYQKVITILPVTFGYEHEISNKEKTRLVMEVCDHLANLYSYHPDEEISISYTMTPHQCINV